MRLWRVTVVVGQFRRYAGVGVVMADRDTEARAVMAEYLRNDHAYGKPYEVSRVEAHESGEPYVAFFNWGESPCGWPARTNLPQQPGSPERDSPVRSMLGSGASLGWSLDPRDGVAGRPGPGRR